MIKMCQIRTRHPTVALATKTDKKRTKHERNESETSSRLFKRESGENSKISLSQNCQPIQSVEKLKIISNLSYQERLKKNKEMKTGEASKNGKGRKMAEYRIGIAVIKRLDKCTSDCFIAPIVITVKKDHSIKMALDAEPINRQLFKNKYQMPNVDELLGWVSQIDTANTNVTLHFSVLDLKYAYSQLKLTAETAKQCNFNIKGGQATGTYRFLTELYGLADMPAMDRTLNHAKITFCFLDDLLIVSKGSEHEHEKLIKNVLEKLDKENLALKLSKCEFFQNEVNWLGHKLSLDGISPKITKKEAILKLSPPTSLRPLRSFSGSH